jgi:4'-phosphopantetheinyl transferase EntD
MNSEALCQTLRELLPKGVCVAAGRALETPLTELERTSLGAVRAERMCEFQSGRAYAKRALAMIDIHDVDLPMGPDRKPAWPTGVVGSITHVRCGHDLLYAAAVVAPTETASAVGIDFEMEDNLPPAVWPYVLTRRELERVLALPAGRRGREALYIWCAKEAAAKTAVHQLDLSNVEVDRDARGGDFVARFPDGGAGKRRTEVSGRTAGWDRLLIATAVVPQARIS